MQFERGKLVEFTNAYEWNYTLRDKALARYGVVTEDTNGPIVKVHTSKGIESIPSNRIHAYAWAGWMPEEIEQIWETYQSNDWEDY